LALEAIRKSLPDCHLYPDDAKYSLKVKLAKLHNVKKNQILIGNGSVELILMMGLAYTEPRHSMVFSDIAFIIPKIVTQIIGCKANLVPHKKFVCDLDGLLAAIDETTRIVYIDNPNNPAGTCNTREEMDAFMEKVPDHVLVVLDEAYYEYSISDTFPDSEGYLAAGKNVLILRTFSKVHGLAGLRVGYGISTPEIIESLMKVRMPFNLNRLAHVAAEAALDDKDHVAKSVEVNREGLKYFYSAFDSLGLAYEKSCANFLLTHFERDTMDLFTQLRQMGLVVRPLHNYGLPNSLRITVCTQDMNERLIKGMKKVL
jgi:histidinol-phosphate aminotransferase